jgi:hypothetical protein
MTITTQQGEQIDMSTIRDGRILFTQDVAMGYNFVNGESTKVHWSVDSGACIFWPDEIRLDGEITEDVLATFVYIPES